MFVNIAFLPVQLREMKGRWTYSIQGKCQPDKWFIEGTQSSQLNTVFCIRELGAKQPRTGIKTSLTPTIPYSSVDPVETEWPKEELQSLKDVRRDHRSEVHFITF